MAIVFSLFIARDGCESVAFATCFSLLCLLFDFTSQPHRLVLFLFVDRAVKASYQRDFQGGCGCCDSGLARPAKPGGRAEQAACDKACCEREARLLDEEDDDGSGSESDVEAQATAQLLRKRTEARSCTKTGKGSCCDASSSRTRDPAVTFCANVRSTGEAGERQLCCGGPTSQPLSHGRSCASQSPTGGCSSRLEENAALAGGDSSCGSKANNASCPSKACKSQPAVSSHGAGDCGSSNWADGSEAALPQGNGCCSAKPPAAVAHGASGCCTSSSAAPNQGAPCTASVDECSSR